MIESPVWEILGIEPTDDRDRIRRAYTHKLKTTNPEDDPAGFQRLRAAYDTALRFITLGIAFETPHYADEPEPEPEPGQDVDIALRLLAVPLNATVVSPAVRQVHEDYGKLRELLDRDDPGAEALQVFARICASNALDDVSLRLELERSLSALLVQCMPKSSELVLRAARTFGWSDQRARIGAVSTIQVAAKCAEDLAFVRGLQAGGQPLSAGFRALTSRPVRWLLRLRILVHELDVQVSALLGILSFERPYAHAALNEDAVAWWNRYFSKPRLSRGMVLTSLAAPVAAAWFTSGPLEWSAPRVRSTVLVAALSMIAATAAKLFVLDWGRIYFRKRFERGMPAWASLGWLPVVTLLAVAAGLGVALWPLSALCVVWAWYSRRDSDQEHFQPSVPLLIYVNLPLIAWVALLGTVLSWPVVLTFACAAGAHITGQSTLAAFWLTEVSPAVRAKAVAALLVFVLVFGVAIVVNAQHDESYGLFAGLAITAVLLQRTAVVVLTAAQMNTRYYITWASLFAVGIGLANLDAAGVAVVLTSTWFLFGTAIGLSIALNNDIRSARLLRGE